MRKGLLRSSEDKQGSSKMKCLIVKQRFVVEPGDAILSPAHAVHSARNLYAGTSLRLESHKPWWQNICSGI